MSTNNITIELFTVRQLAEFLKKKPSTIYSDITRRPESLPPVFRAPGSSRPLFVNPQQWVAGLAFPEIVNNIQQIQKVASPKKRGRPSKANIAQKALLGVVEK